ncbi:MAG: DNA polymerase III subunit delta [Lachnospiraceae bacterium]|nr:DNA polymerase III subunit delta [Lachnospiraceae bacterium]
MQTILKNIKENNFQNVYLLYGDERYLKQQYTEKLRKALAGDDEMNLTRYEGKDVPVGEIIDLAETMPFLAERRVIVLKDTGLFKSGGDQLAEYLSAPNDTTFFLFSESEVDKRCKLYKTVASKGHVAEFTTQDENTLKRWVAQLLGKSGKKVTEATVTYFLSKTGTDMQNIQTETEKLICYCLDRDVVTNADVDAICSTILQDRIFDMVEAAARHRTKEALTLYYDLLALKVQPLQILAMLARQYNLMLQAKELRNQGMRDKEIASKIGVPPFVVSKYISQASHYKTSEIRAMLEKCVQADADVKMGIMNDKLSVELIILGDTTTA